MAYALTPAQRQVASTILSRGQRRHATAREMLAAIETGIVESRLSNPPGGSGSSVGWRQETASSYPNVNRLDVGGAADRFFRETAAKRGMRGTAGSLAQAVQRSAYPGRYDKSRSAALNVLQQFGVAKGGKISGGGGGLANAVISAGGGGTVSAPEPGGTQLADFLAQQMTARRPAPSAPPPLPAFAAQARLPAGYQSVASGPPAPPPVSIDDALKAIQAIPQQDTPTVSGGGGATVSVTGGGGGASPSAPGGGRVRVAPGADRAGVRTQQSVLNFVQGVSARSHHPVTITTGTNHNRMTVNGNVSDHWTGHAADIAVPVDSHEGDLIATAALEQAGVPRSRARAMARRGGLYTLNSGGHRIQVIWKTNAGGNHHNHVHIGVR